MAPIAAHSTELWPEWEFVVVFSGQQRGTHVAVMVELFDFVKQHIKGPRWR
jgi:hypothetical protein